MDYMAYDQQNNMYLVLAGTSWVPSKRRDLVKPSSKEKLERMINQVSKAYDGHFLTQRLPLFLFLTLYLIG